MSLSRESGAWFLDTTRGSRHLTVDVHASHFLPRGEAEHRHKAVAHARFCLNCELLQLCDSLTNGFEQSAKQVLVIVRGTKNFNNGEHIPLTQIFDVGRFVDHIIHVCPTSVIKEANLQDCREMSTGVTERLAEARIGLVDVQQREAWDPRL